MNFKRELENILISQFSYCGFTINFSSYLFFDIIFSKMTPDYLIVRGDNLEKNILSRCERMGVIKFSLFNGDAFNSLRVLKSPLLIESFKQSLKFFLHLKLNS